MSGQGQVCKMERRGVSGVRRGHVWSVRWRGEG